MKQSLISFLYFDDMPAACRFFEEVFELPCVTDQGWAKIYRVSPGAFIGAVDKARGSLACTARDGVLTAFAVENADEWAERLRAKGAEFTLEPRIFPDIGIKTMMIRGPEGYIFEIEQFLREEDLTVYY